MKKVIEDLHETDISHRNQLSVIISRCRREIMLAEISGDKFRKKFAEEIMNLSKIEEQRGR